MNITQEKPREECGVFGIALNEKDDFNVAALTRTALFSLQHRGQESAGIVTNDRGKFNSYKNTGLVNEVFTEETMRNLAGKKAIGHVRYSAAGAAALENAQPLVIWHLGGNLAVAHNGCITNAEAMRQEFERSGAIFQTLSDSEVIAYAIVRERLNSNSIEEAIKKAMNKLEGAYSIVAMGPNKVVAARDPNGFRPLCIGKLGESYCVASETCALDAIGAEFLRDVNPGEIIVLDNGELRSYDSGLKGKPGLCVFEFVYFARPDSTIDGIGVDMSRQMVGRFLAKESPVEADLVVGVPDSGISAAIGYSYESGIPYSMGMVKNRYIGRTFIQTSQRQREDSVRLKLSPVTENIKGKRIVLVDDSIVRGTTCARIIKMLREAGAAEVHMRIASPPFRHPCYFGTDISSRDALIANHHSIEEIRRIIGTDTLAYLSIEAMREIACMGTLKGGCVGCFTGKYPIKVEGEEICEE